MTEQSVQESIKLIIRTLADCSIRKSLEIMTKEYMGNNNNFLKGLKLCNDQLIFMIKKDKTLSRSF